MKRINFRSHYDYEKPPYKQKSLKLGKGIQSKALTPEEMIKSLGANMFTYFDSQIIPETKPAAINNNVPLIPPEEPKTTAPGEAAKGG